MEKRDPVELTCTHPDHEPVRIYLQALRTKQTGKATHLREAHAALVPYFNFVEHALACNPYYEI